MDLTHLLCQTCLSYDRKLYPICGIGHIITGTNISEISNNAGGICWECRSLIFKFYNFKEQVSRAQLLLNNPLQPLENLTPLSALTSTININGGLNIEHEPSYAISENVLKEELDLTESVQEADLTADDSSDEDDQYLSKIKNKTEPENTVTIKSEEQIIGVPLEEAERKPVVSLPKTPKAPVLPKYKSVKHSLGTVVKNEPGGQFAKMYTTIIYNAEEMNKIRQDKTRQPNYKILQFKCDSCVKGFVKEELFKQHLSKCHGEQAGAFTCEVCLCKYRTATSRDKHRQTHSELYKCNLCKYETVSKSYLMSHLESKHGMDNIDKIHCQLCNKVFSNMDELNAHSDAEHRVSCDICGAQFKKHDILRSHKRRVHQGIRKFACTSCRLTFLTRSRLESHLARHGPLAAQRLAYCQPCGIQFKDIYIYRNHLKNNSKHAAGHICPICNMKVASKTYLKKHIEYYHNKESKFQCNDCEKKFISKTSLRYHCQMKHGAARSRNHSCPHCPKKFFTPSTLRMHVYTHKSERSFMCAECGDTFKQGSALYNHTRLVHRGVKKKPQKMKS